AFVPLQNADGQRINSTIVSVDATTVVVDLNHPFAGCDLQFAGSIVEARTATADEITAMVKMLSGEGGCSCGCEGDCEGGCGGEEGAGCGDKGGCSCH
ncbi:MAG: peptidylprolyl isomerase, partial [Bacteroidaceae bacterium]